MKSIDDYVEKVKYEEVTNNMRCCANCKYIHKGHINYFCTLAENELSENQLTVDVKMVCESWEYDGMKVIERSI